MQVFQEASKPLKAHVERSGRISSGAAPASTVPSGSNDGTARKLMESVIAAERRTKAEKILCNVEAAAMDLGVLLQVCLILLPLYLRYLNSSIGVLEPE